jgi:hypothetical protein
MTSNGTDSSARLTRLTALGPLIPVGVIIVLAMAFGVSRVGCGNHHTPPGYVGYIRTVPFIGAGEYAGTQGGPTSTGYVWRQDVVNIDVRTRTYSEEMTIPTSNRLQLGLKAHARIRIRAEKVRDLVETLGGDRWYVNNVQGRFRSSVRDKVQVLEPFEVKDKMREVGDGVLADMTAQFADTPIEFLSVDVGDIGYPGGVTESVIAKFVTNEENERRNIELRIAQRQIDVGIAEAQGMADAQRTIRTTLDAMFLQFEALRAIEELAGSPNTTFMVMPVSKTGGSPVILSVDK